MTEDEQRTERGKDGATARDVPGVELIAVADPFVDRVEEGLVAAFSAAGLLTDLNPASFATFVRLRIMVAVSGGPDSTALLAAVVALAGKMGFTLTACHVNHQTRGEDSVADEAFCRQLCERWRIPLDVRPITPGGPPERQPAPPSRPSEASLRESRYRELTEAAHASQAHYVLVAHTLDDQIETMLFRLFRGTGLAGLIGMEPARRLSTVTTLLRPLLTIKREDCLDYLGRLGIEPRMDASNTDVAYARNYIRHRVIPVIEEKFPGFQGRLEQLRQRVVAEDTLVAEVTEQSFARFADPEDGQRWRVEEFKALPTAVQRRAIASALRGMGIEVNFARVTSVLDLIFRGAELFGSRMSLSAEWDVAVDRHQIVWVNKFQEMLTDEELAGGEQLVKVPGLTILPALGRALRIEDLAGKPAPPSGYRFPGATAWEALVDLTGAGMPLTVRARRPGDVIRPFGMQQLVKLKKFLHNHKPPDRAPTRRGPLLLLADRDEVVWVPGIGLSNKIRVTGSPTHRLSWIPLAQDEIYYS